ncbi:Type III secretion protein YscO [Labrenzia sp. THAF82]|uniref:type III secretion system stalk subunit SctO n=1 Tax=Labrenzia sp. THAF82 TaxID=2587861 RepID=UPI0012A88A5E|nr:YscO family type III secretion system apparatus protein [Labrenzia sp. THAF82]QFT33940.1 Type III secretion protein YscO [Labrenzia sp. THAF82]
MIEKLKVLQRVKETREFAALRLMRAKKNELQEANRVRAENERSFLESKQTLPVREDGIYEDILNKVVNLDLLDIVGERVSDLHLRHRKTEQDLDQSMRKQEEVTEETAIAMRMYQKAQQSREKYDAMIRECEAEFTRVLEKDEEARIEDVAAFRQSGNI